MITLRLDAKLEQAVNNTAENLGLSKSELIRKSIYAYLERLSNQNAWKVGEELFGKYSSGLGNLSTNRKELIKRKIKAKRE